MFPRRLAYVNRRITNPMLRPLAGYVPPFAVVEHVGRRSGRRYRTPVFAFRRPRDIVVVLSYGRDSDWARNVLASSGGKVMRGGRRRKIANPRVVRVGECGPLSLLGRFSCRFAGADDVLVADIVD